MIGKEGEIVEGCGTRGVEHDAFDHMDARSKSLFGPLLELRQECRYQPGRQAASQELSHVPCIMQAMPMGDGRWPMADG